MSEQHTLNPFSGEFHNHELELRYRHSVRARDARYLRNSLFVVAFLFPLFGLVDYYLIGFGGNFWLLCLMRTVVALASLLLARALLRNPGLADDALPLNFVLFLLATCIILIVPLRPEAINTQLTAVLCITLMLYIFIPNRVQWMAALCLYLAMGFILALHMWRDPSPGTIAVVGLVLLLPNVVGLITVLRLNRLQREEFVALLAARDANRELQQEIARREHLELELRQLAQTDDLTGLNNRRWFLELAVQALRQTRRSNTPFAVLMVDIDHFKTINDTRGHAAGDTVLALVASQCRLELRETDIVGRFGGEEFVLALPNADATNVREIAERLRERIENFRLPDELADLRLTVTVGIAEALPGEKTLEPVLQRADQALYMGKRDGRNTVILASTPRLTEA